MAIRNRITEMLGVEVPIIQAPMGWIARSTLASAVSNAGGMGIIETSSGALVSRRSDYDGLVYAEDGQFLRLNAQLYAARDAGLLVDQAQLVERLEHLVD